MAKCRGLRCEYVPEWVKPFAYTVGLDGMFPTQCAILEHQAKWISRFLGQVEWVITDSPLWMGLAYTDDPAERAAIRAVSALFTNVDVFVRRVKAYAPYGRMQDAYEATQLDWRIRAEHPEPFAMELAGDPLAPQFILDSLLCNAEASD
jgi:hypothetical protein